MKEEEEEEEEEEWFYNLRGLILRISETHYDY
jgi:hypothetical protein